MAVVSLVVAIVAVVVLGVVAWMQVHSSESSLQKQIDETENQLILKGTVMPIRSKNRKEHRVRAIGPVVVLVLALIVTLTPLSTPRAQAQTYSEGPDYNFFYATFAPPAGTLRLNWNLYGGAKELPYYIHVDVIADGFEAAVHDAFATMENDPGSEISFVYMGSTTVVSEIVGIGASCCPDPSDGINVVSYGVLPQEFAALGGLAGLVNFDGSGQPTGVGDGHFDITLSSTANFSDSPGADTVDVESMVLHELGHALGLDHPATNQDTVMWDTLLNSTTKRDLHPADQQALSILYGCGTGEPGCQAVCNGESVTHDMNALGVSVLTGTSGDDVILGTPGADTIDAGAGNDTVCAGEGDDVVVGGDGNDTLNGDSGRDTMRGNAGDDTIDGGAGDFYDVLYGGDGDDTINGGFGIDIIWGEDGADTLDGDGGSDHMWGGPGNDLMLGDSGADRMYGGPGDDELRGMGGQDFMWGEAGNDRMQGNWQSDNLFGGPGDDTMFGAGGKDSLFGEAGNDTMSGGLNTDYLNGGDGTDSANGGRGRDKPLVEPQQSAGNGQWTGGSGCIAETILSCQTTP